MPSIDISSVLTLFPLYRVFKTVAFTADYADLTGNANVDNLSIAGLKFPSTPGSNGQVLTTNGIDQMNWSSSSSSLQRKISWVQRVDMTTSVVLNDKTFIYSPYGQTGSYGSFQVSCTTSSSYVIIDSSTWGVSGKYVTLSTTPNTVDDKVFRNQNDSFRYKMIPSLDGTSTDCYEITILVTIDGKVCIMAQQI